MGDRFREHLSSRRLPDSDLLVGRHFAFPGHTTQDMLVSVIRSSFRDAADRRSFEARIIFKHCTLHPGGFNADFGFIKSQRALPTRVCSVPTLRVRYLARAVFSCFQTSYEEGVSSKPMVHI